MCQHKIGKEMKANYISLTIISLLLSFLSAVLTFKAIHEMEWCCFFVIVFVVAIVTLIISFNKLKREFRDKELQ